MKTNKKNLENCSIKYCSKHLNIINKLKKIENDNYNNMEKLMHKFLKFSKSIKAQNPENMNHFINVVLYNDYIKYSKNFLNIYIEYYKKNKTNIIKLFTCEKKNCKIHYIKTIDSLRKEYSKIDQYFKLIFNKETYKKVKYILQISIKELNLIKLMLQNKKKINTTFVNEHIKLLESFKY